MDFTKLNLGPKAVSRIETAVVITPQVDGEPIPLTNGESLTLTMTPPNTPEGQREVRKWALRYGRKDADLEKLTEAELDALVAREMEGEAELAARVVHGWNLVNNDGSPVECTLENRKAFFGHFHAIRADTILQMSAQVEALGNAPKP